MTGTVILTLQMGHRLRKLFRALLVQLSDATNMLCLTSGPGVPTHRAPPTQGGRGKCSFSFFAFWNIKTHLQHYLLHGPQSTALSFFSEYLYFISHTELWAILHTKKPPQPWWGCRWVSEHTLIYESRRIYRMPVARDSLCLLLPQCIKLGKTLSQLLRSLCHHLLAIMDFLRS